MGMTVQMYDSFQMKVLLAHKGLMLIFSIFVAATKQLYEWFCPSVCHTFFHYVAIIVSSSNFE